MKSSWKSIAGVVLGAVITFAMIAPGLTASPSARGKFKLAFDAQWGVVALPTGDYRFVIDNSTGSNGTIRVYRGDQAVGMVLPLTVDRYKAQGKKPELVCVRHDGKVTIRALRLPDVGTFYFSLPKGLKVLVAQQPQLIQTVSVEVGGQ